MNKILILIGVLFLLGGLGFSFLPHEWHNKVLEKIGHGTEEKYHGSHKTHQWAGFVVAVIGIGIVLTGKKTW